MTVVVTEESAAVIERYAREKAWRDFLGHVLFSLMVWQLDEGVRAECEPVPAWLRRCRDEIDEMAAR